jgi:hypothetical protein
MPYYDKWNYSINYTFARDFYPECLHRLCNALERDWDKYTLHQLW